jgi:threonine dehydrogenase-like Zn-dependent dehydrogenase
VLADADAATQVKVATTGRGADATFEVVGVESPVATAAGRKYSRVRSVIARCVVDVRVLVSEVSPLADGASWFARLRQPQTDLLKVMLLPSNVEPSGSGEEHIQ